MLTKELHGLPSDSVVRLDNVTCPYCGNDLNGAATDEHVIGRRFVPKGMLDCQWNLILRACGACNNRKADLENDLSAITMQPNAFGEYSQSDPVLAREAERKARHSISRRTGKPVAASSEEIKIEVPFGPGVQMTFNLHSSPQVNRDRVFHLARMQLMAFFYWITYQRDTRKGGFWLGGFFPLLETVRSDWGNPVLRGFARAVAAWEPRVLAQTAGGFFKLIIRRHPTEVCWAWGVEWNHNLRATGFFGERDPIQQVASEIPKLPTRTIAAGPDERIHFRTETPLAEEEDQLFHWEEPRG